MLRASTIAFLIAACAAPGWAPASAPADLTPRGVSSTIRRSTVKYDVHALRALKDPPVSLIPARLWPEQTQDAGGGDGEASGAIRAVEALFAAGQRAEAETAALDLVGRFPSSSRGHRLLGDAYALRGDHERALWAYREAGRLDPSSADAAMGEGRSLAELGWSSAALDAFVRALSLRAYHEGTMQLAAVYARQLGIDPRPERFAPRAFVRRKGARVDLYVDEAPHWRAWAECKAVWLAEPGYRPAAGWSSEEDRSCLINLLEVYANHRDLGTAPREPYLDRVLDVADKKLLDELVVYELGTRVAPGSLVVMATEHPELAIARLVREFVIPKAPISPEVP